ncbi:hypothetical protein N007_09550 [Alicyclobacillus acidoterrestris ATCC 49025]|nr:hypothetical protein N007_09550 [Alicyclobacillus acidoterrestris ATCC 49025]
MRLSRLIIGVSTAASVWGLMVASAHGATDPNDVHFSKSASTVKQVHRVPVRAKSRQTKNRTVHKSVRNHSAQSSGRSRVETKQNLYWMARVINAEAGGESRMAQIGVGDVVLHRLRSGKHGTSVHDVVFETVGGVHQFSCVPNGAIYKTPNASSIQAAKDVLNGAEDVPHATVFYNPSETSSSNWVQSRVRVKQYDHLVFAK